MPRNQWVACPYKSTIRALTVGGTVHRVLGAWIGSGPFRGLKWVTSPKGKWAEMGKCALGEESRHPLDKGRIGSNWGRRVARMWHAFVQAPTG